MNNRKKQKKGFAKLLAVEKQKKVKKVSLKGDDAEKYLAKLISLERPIGLSDEEWGTEIEKTMYEFVVELKNNSN